jgi:hypothetical protein
MSEKQIKLYLRYDSLDEESGYSLETLEDMRQWLVDLWDNNPDEDMDEEEHKEFIEDIWSSDESEMRDRLAGVGYSFYCLTDMSFDDIMELLEEHDLKDGNEERSRDELTNILLSIGEDDDDETIYVGLF